MLYSNASTNSLSTYTFSAFSAYPTMNSDDFTVYSYSFFFFSSRRRHTRLQGDWSSDVCSSDLGAGDTVADALKQLGMNVTMLSTEDLATADLSKFQTIVLGVRAYAVRDDLRA